MPDTTPDRDTIVKELVAVLSDMTADWDTASEGPIGPQTRLIADLGFESIDVVHLVVAIEERFQRRDFPFQELLMENGQYVDELTVAQVVDFIARSLSAS